MTGWKRFFIESATISQAWINPELSSRSERDQTASSSSSLPARVCYSRLGGCCPGEIIVVSTMLPGPMTQA